MDNLVFSVNGETVYFVDVKAKISRITAWDVLSGEFKAENIIGGSCVVPVKEGVLLTTSSGTLELWNFQLTECVRCWTDIRNIHRDVFGFRRNAWYVQGRKSGN